MATTRAVGYRGEELTAKYLKEKGYDILETNYRSKYGEVDIIAQKKDTLVAVEVKTRKKGSMVPLLYSISEAQKKRIAKSALNYLQENSLDLQIRFDVALIEHKDNKDNKDSIKYFEAAFDGSVLGDSF